MNSLFSAVVQPPSKPPGNIVFVSLGMVVLDELHLADGRVLHDVAGGSGTLGARMATSAAQPRRVACFILAGRDFPESITEALETWKISLFIDKEDSRLSTRSLLRYDGEDFQNRTFKYTTSPLQPTPADLERSGLTQSNSFHMLASPDLLAEFVSQILELRARGPVKTARPLLAWEPAPAFCTLANRDAHLESAKLVDIYSPNHKEFLSTFHGPLDENTSLLEFDRVIIENEALRVLDSGVGTNADGVVVVRCGEHGSLVVSRSYPARWFPAFHGGESVIDATGAGNAFLGALTVRFDETKDLTEAAIAGSVAASFAIEQIGVPGLLYTDQGGGRELWNGVDFSSRLEEYTARLN